MHTKERFPNLLFGANLKPESAALAILVLLLFLMFVFLFITLTAQPAQAQTNVLYNFTDRSDGAFPAAGLTMDGAGNLYGTTCGRRCGGTHDYGTVFMLSRRGSGWLFATLYTFQGGMDGSAPFSGVVLDESGSLYGATAEGGIGTCYNGDGCGTIFKLTPPIEVARSVMHSWTKTVLYRFTGGSDGGNPYDGSLVFDQRGNIYGTTLSGGSPDCGYCGVVFELTPSASGWTESILHTFNGGDDGQSPYSGLIFDSAGNLYGTTGAGGSSGDGVVYQLTSTASGWTQRILYAFQGGSDGAVPVGGLILDQNGNLAGTTSANTSYGSGGGTVFRLEPRGDTWYFDLLYQIAGGPYQYYSGPEASLTSTDGPLDKNYYGTTLSDGSDGNGTIFALTYHCAGSCPWQYDTLTDLDGFSYSSLVLDASPYAYGTTWNGGTHRAGSVFRIQIPG